MRAHLQQRNEVCQRISWAQHLTKRVLNVEPLVFPTMTLMKLVPIELVLLSVRLQLVALRLVALQLVALRLVALQLVALLERALLFQMTLRQVVQLHLLLLLVRLGLPAWFEHAHVIMTMLSY